MEAGGVAGGEGFGNLVVGHVAMHDLFADSLTTALEAELDDFAAALDEESRGFLAEEANVRIADEGDARDFAVALDEIGDVRGIEREEIVVENEPADIGVSREQVPDLVDYGLGGVVADVVEGLAFEAGILFVEGDHPVVEAVRAPERASARGHQADPAALGVNHALEVEDLVVLGRELGERRQRPDGVTVKMAVVAGPDVPYARRVAPLVDGPGQLDDRFLPLPYTGVVENAGLKRSFRVHRRVDAADDDGDVREGALDLRGEVDGVFELRRNDGEADEAGLFGVDAQEELMVGRKRSELVVEIDEGSFVAGGLEGGG